MKRVSLIVLTLLFACKGLQAQEGPQRITGGNLSENTEA